MYIFINEYSPTERANSLPFSSPFPVAPVPLTNKGCRHFKMGTLNYLYLIKLSCIICFNAHIQWF